MTSSLQASRWIVLDDTDSSITYSGAGWFTTNEAKENFGNFGPTYLSTLHGTNSSAEISFTFNGSSARLFGTNEPGNESGIIDPNCDCLLDETSIGRTDQFFYNWVDGAAGEHTLTVRASSQGQTFWADMIDYVPLPGASVASGQVVAVHHADEAIRYGEGWLTTSTFAKFAIESGATVELDFEGTRLNWWGHIPDEYPRAPTTATYAIDGGSPTTFALRGLAKEEPFLFNQRFFQTPPLSPGSHTIRVVYGGNHETTPLTLTHVSIEGATSVSSAVLHSPNATEPVTPPVVPSSNINPSSTLRTNVIESFSYSTFFPHPSQSSNTPNINSTEGSATTQPVGAIVGAVVGGVALVAATTLVIFWLSRRRSKQVATPKAEVQPASFGPLPLLVQYFNKEQEASSAINSQPPPWSPASQGVLATS